MRAPWRAYAVTSEPGGWRGRWARYSLNLAFQRRDTADLRQANAAVIGPSKVGLCVVW